MPAPTFNQDDLLLPQEELSQLHVALANFGQGDPLATAVAESTATVSLYTSRYVLDDATWRRLMRPLAIWHLYSLVGQVPEAHQKARDAAVAELEAIRDGKFPLPLAGGTTNPGRAGAWGSDFRVSLR